MVGVITRSDKENIMSYIKKNLNNYGSKQSLPHEDNRRGDNTKIIEQHQRVVTVLWNTLEAHHLGLWKQETSEKYDELSRELQCAKCFLAFWQGMPTDEVLSMWESNERQIEQFHAFR
tara:strand:- start:709 stop:1062 length:354 start_codon:yes stop_codon:yes gene_type:complete